MNYEKKYKEALERAKRLHSDPTGGTERIVCEQIFPELAESEDEKIRKALIEIVHDTTCDSLLVDYNVHKEDALAWLEKQGEQILANSEKTCKDEQKRAEWSEEDEEFLRRAIKATKEVYPVTANWLNSLKQRIGG